MTPIISTLIISLGLLFLSVSSAAAQVVINEINASGEWVELFKTVSGAVPLEGCTIFFHDNDSQKKVLTAADNFLENEFYKVITTGSNYLNNTSSDTVLLDCPDFDAGPVVYPDNLGTKSYARVPNGTGNFVVTGEVSQGSENPSPITPTPTPSPSPTLMATAAPAASPTPAATPTKTATPAPPKSPSPKPTATPKQIPLSTEETAVLGVAATPFPATPSPAPFIQPQRKRKFSLLPIVLITTGVGMMGFAVYNLIRARKNSFQN